MEELRRYLKTLDGAAKVQFAATIGTTLGYLRKALSVGTELGIRLCIAIEDATDGAVMIDDLLPDIDWNGYCKRRSARLRRRQRAMRKVAR